MRIRLITDRSDPALTAAGRVYADSIRGDERKPVQWLIELPGRAEYRLLVHETESSADGMAVVFWTSAFSLLEYLAVDQTRRGSGVGTHLFHAAVQVCQDRPMLIEVDPVTDELSQTRQQFYHRQGCRTLDVNYKMPLTTPPMAMDLMIHPGESRPDDKTIRRWIGEIHRRVYEFDDPV